ncbi:MAG: ferritin family protein [Planctomycetota bacterium]|jgi:rubrerythrin
MKEIETYYELLEFAISREVQANRFYLTLAELVENPQIRKTLEDLAQEELEHKALLEIEVMKRGRTVDTEQKAADFHVPDDNVDPDLMLDMEYKEMLQLAIAKEDVSFRLYIDLVALAKEQESKEVLYALAEEEAKHKLRFKTEYDNLLKQNP